MSDKKGFHSGLRCDICKIDFSTKADHALHEFTKKHCDNLLKLSRNKPVVTKQKKKSDSLHFAHEKTKPNIITQSGSFAKYGYFIPGEIYNSSNTFKEFNTDYDPYLQKFAENPYKAKVTKPTLEPSSTQLYTTCDFSKLSKKKRKKIKICQICNVTLTTVPDYDSHMKSPQHIWKLKMSGMGMTAHFVKASSDLQTTGCNDFSSTQQSIKSIASNECQSSAILPSLFCDTCDLLLNSVQQYNIHVNGRAHLETVKKKAELKANKEKFLSSTPNQLFCFSCKISLNNLCQYNEHKNGRKHKLKCRQLMRKGIVIPPEERVSEWSTLKSNPHTPVAHLFLNEKLITEKKSQNESLGFNTLDVMTLEKKTLLSENNKESSNFSSLATLSERLLTNSTIPHKTTAITVPIECPGEKSANIINSNRRLEQVLTTDFSDFSFENSILIN